MGVAGKVAHTNSSAPTMASTLRPSSAHQVRTKFLSMLGLEQQQKQPTSPISTATQQFVMDDTTTAGTAAALATAITTPNEEEHQVTPRSESLKYNKAQDRIYTTTTTNNSPKTKRKHHKKTRRNTTSNSNKISFDESVKVIPIPKRDEYSIRVRQRLWAGAMEIHQNATRNTIEFISEGWDWRKVTEDESMYLCSVTGELIHPCHYQNTGIEPGDFIP